MSEAEFARQRAQILAEVPVPLFWLFGKTGSGKSSVVRYLTGESGGVSGAGYRPQTQRSQQYDFPSAESPLLRFVDTCGLGEIAYDPAEDIRQLNKSAHLMIVTVRAADHALADLLGPLAEIRAASPRRPVVVAITWLHEFYPQQQHPQPDPFQDGENGDTLPAELRRSLQRHHHQFAQLADRIVPLDFTRPEEGFREPFFGGDRLKEALRSLLPEAYRQALLQLDQAAESLKDLSTRRAMPYILSYSTMAGAAAAAPAAWVDIPAVLAIQSRLVYRLAAVYGQSLNAQILATMITAVGGRIAARLALRGPLKVIPWLGMTANAAMAFTYTYALGKACCWYFGERNRGNVPSGRELEEIWSEQLTLAARLWSAERES
ncbi:MAG: DUF697 domain-containing protein [Planctomycetales bacterium]|nr:DUF697 domain-containing protein [Planctomycetales bacterium]